MEAHVEQRHDGGVVEGAGGARLDLETPPPLGIAAAPGGRIFSATLRPRRGSRAW